MKKLLIYACACVCCMILCNCGSEAEQVINRWEVQNTDWHDTLSNASSQSEALVPMDRRVERFMEKWDLRGMSLAITRNDSLLFAKGYGWANAEFNIPMTPNTLTRIASASKLVTGVAIMKLCEEGKMSLNSRLFGETGILNDSVYTQVLADERMKDITIDHLLQHLGGFSNRAGDPMFNTRDIMKWNELTEVPRGKDLALIALKRNLATDPGTMHNYSNFGYLLLSLAIEKVTGKSYWDYLKDDVLSAVCATGFYPATNYLSERYDNESYYYAPDTVLVEEFNNSGKMVPRVYGGSDIYGLMGAGGWIASAPAMARLAASIDGHPGVRDVLCDSTIITMTQRGEEVPICRGWSEIDQDGNWIRTGTLYSSHSLVLKFHDNECWVMTTNTGVWIGYNFSRHMIQLAKDLRAEFDDKLPNQNLWTSPAAVLQDE